MRRSSVIAALAALLSLPAAGPRAAAGRHGGVIQVAHEPSAMVSIPAGTFYMGFDETDEDEQTDLTLACTRELGSERTELYCRGELLWANAVDYREVYLPAYSIDRFEVTVDQYRACAAAGGCSVEPLVFDPVFLGEGLPMVNVTWQEATDYCAWARKRLPTEAEWEKAARGTDGRRWPWGDQWRGDGANHGKVDRDLVRGDQYSLPRYTADATDSFERAAPPGALRWSDSVYGVYDMAGNVSEWVADYYRDSYVGLSTIDPVVDTPPAGTSSQRVCRGGSWAEPPLFGRTYFRAFADPDHRSYDRGFRCARDLD